ncbi:hypothetical protein HMPREF9372_1920 [Sporosarcina newyorkensis 2681]|uniref:Uncharacterized protein n=1 Tax=Sporosarcina newyorkensis 2681 TaxID=1027292 RepID=F9DSY9_9BACL|nr:hypothetical protein [Sporosarcina newyorkensis]EGQ26053.1 hypothetical protein HMPREF9372_1920 [Sporosarcina newyorkensis 2681]
MDKNIRHLFHQETINTEIGLDFEASEEEAARVRENATGKEYREALKETYRKTEKKRR